MQKCPKCSAEVDDNFDICWNCQYSFPDGKILDNTDFSVVCSKCNAETAATSKFCPNCGSSLSGLGVTGFEKLMEPKSIECLRCNTTMTYMATSHSAMALPVFWKSYWQQRPPSNRLTFIFVPFAEK